MDRRGEEDTTVEQKSEKTRWWSKEAEKMEKTLNMKSKQIKYKIKIEKSSK